jgi:predicted phosphoadenosine phosphosulfate sulfurtransferase
MTFVMMCMMMGGKDSSVTMHLISSLVAAAFYSRLPLAMRPLSY